MDDLELIAQCAAYGARGEPFRGMVEQLLMYEPWRDDGKALGEAVARGDVPFNVSFSFGFENDRQTPHCVFAKTEGSNERQRRSGQTAPNGLWEGRFVGADRRRHSVYAKTKREAQEKLVPPWRGRQGIRPVHGRSTVADWLDEWLETVSSAKVRPRTAESYADTVRRYIGPSIGRIPLAKLEPEDISRMLVRA